MCNQLHFQLCLRFRFCNAGWSLAARASHALGGRPATRTSASAPAQRILQRQLPSIHSMSAAPHLCRHHLFHMGAQHTAAVHQVSVCQALTRHTAQSHLQSCLVCMPSQQHCPKHRVKLGRWMCSCYRSCALRGLCMRAWGVQSGRKSRAPQAGCPNLQGVAGKAAAAPPPRVQPPTRPSSSQAASAAAVVPGANAQLGRPGVVAACEYSRATTSEHQDCRSVLRLMHDATVIGCYGRGSLLLKLFRQSCHTAARLWHLFL